MLAAFFEWGVAFHDLDFEAIKHGREVQGAGPRELKGMAGKARARSSRTTSPSRRSRRSPRGRRSRRGRGASRPARVQEPTACDRPNFTANIVRNVWAYAIIFCGHFPDQTYTFSEEEVADETRGGLYVRQLLGAANIEGSPLFHVISGNLGFQVEHHLFPDMPSTRYARDRAAGEGRSASATGCPTTPARSASSWATVQRTILRLAFPGGKPRPKPGPYRGDHGPESAERNRDEAAAPMAA